MIEGGGGGGDLPEKSLVCVLAGGAESLLPVALVVLLFANLLNLDTNIDNITSIIRMYQYRTHQWNKQSWEFVFVIHVYGFADSIFFQNVLDPNQDTVLKFRMPHLQKYINHLLIFVSF